MSVDVAVLFGAIATLFGTLVWFAKDYIGYLKEQNKLSERIVPILERQQTLLEQLLEGRRDAK